MRTSQGLSLVVLAISMLLALQAYWLHRDLEAREQRILLKEDFIRDELDHLHTYRRMAEALPGLKALQNTKSDLPWLVIITPTYKRLVQKADLTRLCHTLLLVPRVHWVVVEDASAVSPVVAKLLARCGVPYTHAAVATPPHLQRSVCKKVDPRHGCPASLLGKEAQLWTKARGVEQRNLGLDHARELAPTLGPAVVYFADDDNAYSLELFEEIRSTEKVAVFTVAFSGGVSYESPKVKDGRVVGWHVAWRPDRPFPVDMAGFAVNLAEITSRPNLRFDDQAERGFLESHFIGAIVQHHSALEPRGLACSCALVWHTRTEVPSIKHDKSLPPDPAIEL